MGGLFWREKKGGQYSREILQLIRKRKKLSYPESINTFCALILADTHGKLESKFGKLEPLLKANQVSIILSLGDVLEEDFCFLNEINELSNLPIFGVLGNHNEFSDTQYFSDLHEKNAMINGICFGGMYGSARYKNYEVPMLTDRESYEAALRTPPCDVFISHDIPKYIYEKCGDAKSHGGMYGIGKYIVTNRPKYHLHGHMHENSEVITPVGTVSYGIYPFAVAIFSNKGMEIQRATPTGQKVIYPLTKYEGRR